MMKKVFSIAIATIALMAVPSFSQTAASTQTQTGNTCENNKVCQIGKKGHRMPPEQKQQCRAAREARLYEGMTLSENQKKQLSELNEKRRADRQAFKAQRKEAKAQTREARAAEKKAMKEMKIAARKEYLREVKKIVGSDNYVIFLENEFLVSSDQGNKSKAGMCDRQRRHGDYKGKMYRNGKKDGLARTHRKPGNKVNSVNGERTVNNSGRA